MPGTLVVVLFAAACQAQAPAATVVPFELLGSGHLVLTVRLNGHGPYRLLLDTGSPSNVLGRRAGQDAGLVLAGERPGFSPRGGMPVRIRSMQVGELTLADLPALVMDHPTLEQIARSQGPLDGILGLPFFGRYRLTLDYRAAALTLTPTGREPPDALAAMTAAVRDLTRAEPRPAVVAPAALWGLQVSRAEGEEQPGVTVRKVAAGGPADRAGLRVGDRMLSLDGRWTDSAADLYRAAETIPPGTAVPVRVRRGEQELTLTVTPVRGL